ncbi:MAG: PQQ-dependent sugar dehydrogenase [Candidatus Magasanikbacteria bacterium]|nr:PQQ-dependent sugar dehydrogenase [Candidatus Magasanikbacteria bacterium]
MKKFSFFALGVILVGAGTIYFLLQREIGLKTVNFISNQLSDQSTEKETISVKTETPTSTLAGISTTTEQATTTKPSTDTTSVQTPPSEKNTTGIPLKLPSGFSISVYAKNVYGARVLRMAPDGNLWVSLKGLGQLAALVDADNDGVAERVQIMVRGLNIPHGFAFRCLSEIQCELYVGEMNQVSRFAVTKNGSSLSIGAKETVLSLPSGGHQTRTLIFLPAASGETREHRLLISVGSTCDLCIESDTRRGTIQVLDVDSGESSTYASGLRNAVFQAIHPLTKAVWVTEMGSDHMGDGIPPDEINILVEGKNYGWPICYGKNIHNTTFDHNTYIRAPCSDPFEVGSYIDIPAHSAPLGLAFVPGLVWGDEYANDVLVAYHGSSKRSQLTGYKIVRMKLDSTGNYFGTEDFITGWQHGSRPEDAYGRPVDILIQSDGVMFISDDKVGQVYRITH